ncbi:MAG: threonylcarbamoyl-AMP synthase [Chloroflexi bacterium]|nr:threonylcarbamoyl-AMP synthase [Chloroflexota bacterium]
MPADPPSLERAARVLRAGGLVAYPTDTLYGLAALPADDEAVRSLFEAKSRPLDQPLPLLIASKADVASVADSTPSVAARLMAEFWPGPLTIVLRKAQSFHSIAVGDTVALRVPAHDVPRALARLLSSPITGTSANVSGGPDPLTADEVRAQLGERVELIIDGGRCPGGGASTVVDCTVDPPRILRDGAIGREALARAAGVAFE